MHSKVIVLGSGPAGYTAAIYAARAMLEPLVIEGLQPGGQLTITTDVENYPGFADAIQGPWLMEQMRAQAEHVGARIAADWVTEVDLRARPFRLTGMDGEYTCDTLIIATGAQAKWLGIEAETTYQGAGISACATCDGFFYKDRPVVVIGGGNTAVEEALYLSNIASKVTLVHRRDSLRAEKILQDRLLTNPRIEVVWNHELVDVDGETSPRRATAARLRSLVDGSTMIVPADGIFVSIGHKPATELFVGQLALKDGGYIDVVPGGTMTSVPGVFAAGDVADDRYRQAVTAAGMGCMAALDVERYLAEMDVVPAIAAE